MKLKQSCFMCGTTWESDGVQGCPRCALDRARLAMKKFAERVPSINTVTKGSQWSAWAMTTDEVLEAFRSGDVEAALKAMEESEQEE